jgi:glycosyltransferase involved in cell wall biosynthesis
VPELLVSVVIPVFNGERFLAEAIESALAQSYARMEVVVVDDGSTDRSAEIARSYPVSYLHQENGGVAAARNRGIEAARGELLSFIDQDDLWLPRKLERQVAALEADGGAGICSCRFEMFLEPGHMLPDWADETFLEGSHRTPQVGTLLVRSEVFDEVGTFDTSYAAANDTDWFLRTRDLGVRVAFVDEPLQRYRLHSGNASAQVGLIRREHMRAFSTSVRRKKAATDRRRAS